MSDLASLSADVIVVGSGPGGSTVARELSGSGKRVVLYERGIDERSRFYYGSYLGALKYSDRFSLLFTKEGLNIIRPIMLGGATSMYCGCAAPPPDWLKSKYKIDLSMEVDQTATEMAIKPLPEELRGSASTRIASAASALGDTWFPQPKFIKPNPHQPFDCTANCMLGCRCGSKWNAAEFAAEAIQNGTVVHTGTKINRVIIESGKAVGVEGVYRGKTFSACADTIILSAGGIGSPRILHRSGIKHAGDGMAMDTTVMVYGFIKDHGIGKEPPMTWSWENDRDGYMLSTLLDPWLLYPLIAARSHWSYIFTWPRWKHILGIMIKLKDDISGGVFPDGTISKPLTFNDRERLNIARERCTLILKEAGADPNRIFTTPLRGTHPSGTVRIGDMLNTDLETDISGLYVCDASVFPEALDRPTVLTIIAFAKRLAKHLAGRQSS